MRRTIIETIAVIAFATFAAVGCGVTTDEGLNAGAGGTGGAGGAGGACTGPGCGTGGTPAVCALGDSKSVACPNGTSGCYCTCQVVNGVASWSSPIYPSAPSGTGGSSAQTNYPAKPTTVCASQQTVDSSTVTINGYPFARLWIVAFTDDNKCFRVNPVWPFANSKSVCTQTAPAQAKLTIFHLSDDNGNVVAVSPALNSTFNGTISSIDSRGYVFCPSAATPVGPIHFNLTAEDPVANDDYWMMINGAAWSNNLPRTAQMCVEKTQKPIAEQGSLGMVVYWNGTTVTVDPTYGGNYRSQ